MGVGRQLTSGVYYTVIVVYSIVEGTGAMKKAGQLVNRNPLMYSFCLQDASFADFFEIQSCSEASV